MSTETNFKRCFRLLKVGDYAIMVSDVKTGILLDEKGSHYKGLDEDYPLIVRKTLEDAKVIAANIVSTNPIFEASIYDFQGNFLEIIRNPKYLNSPNMQREKKAWWKFW